MIVKDVAAKAGVAPHVVRYYTRIGLLKPIRDEVNGYKVFNQEDLRRIGFIRQAQQLGFTLSDIAMVLDQHASLGCASCLTLYAMLHEHVESHRKKIVEMQALQERMETALARWVVVEGNACSGSPLCPAIKQNGCSKMS